MVVVGTGGVGSKFLRSDYKTETEATAFNIPQYEASRYSEMFGY